MASDARSIGPLPSCYLTSLLHPSHRENAPSISPQTTVCGPLPSLRLQCCGHWQLAVEPSKLGTHLEKPGQFRLEQGSRSPARGKFIGVKILWIYNSGRYLPLSYQGRDSMARRICDSCRRIVNSATAVADLPGSTTG